MRLTRVTSAIGIGLLFGAMVPVDAQQDGEKGKSDKEDKGRPQQQGQPEKQARPPRAQQPQQQQAPQQQPQSGTRPQQQPRAVPQQVPTPQRAEQPQQQQQPQRAQQPRQRDQQQPQQQQQPQRAEQPRQRDQQQPQQQQQPQRAQQNYQPQQRSQQQARSWQQQKGWQRQGAWQGGSSWQQDRARNWASDHRTWAQRGGYGGFYIPQASFGLYFGSRHFFRLQTRPVMYMGYPRFDYGGYSFLLLDPWPEYWSDNWYDADDLYIDYDNYDGGYYLYNRTDPQIRLAVMPLA